MRLPVRKIGIGHRSVRSAYPSAKTGRVVQLESSLERDYACLLEFDRHVSSYVEQPVKISYTSPVDAKPHRYTPDFLVEYVDGRPSCLVEIKYRADLRAKWSDYKHRFRAAKDYAAARGWVFKIFTEDEIRNSSYLDNVKFLLRFQAPRAVIRQEYVDLLMDTVDKLDETTPAELLLVIFKDANRRAELIPTLWFLVSEGIIGCNLLLPLTMSSSLWHLD